MIEKLRNIAKERFVPKRSFLFRKGESVGSLFFVQEGLLKAYYDTQDGKQFIKTFVREKGFIGSMQAIVHQEPSTFSTISLENARVLEIARPDLMQAVKTDFEFVSVLNSLLIAVASKKEQREYELLCLSPEERCMLFYKREPDLVSRLSQEDIARYLGITPVSLCRIRKRCQILPPSAE